MSVKHDNGTGVDSFVNDLQREEGQKWDWSQKSINTSITFLAGPAVTILILLFIETLAVDKSENFQTIITNVLYRSDIAFLTFSSALAAKMEWKISQNFARHQQRYSLMEILVTVVQWLSLGLYVGEEANLSVKDSYFSEYSPLFHFPLLVTEIIMIIAIYTVSYFKEQHGAEVFSGNRLLKYFRKGGHA